MTKRDLEEHMDEYLADYAQAAEKILKTMCNPLSPGQCRVIFHEYLAALLHELKYNVDTYPQLLAGILTHIDSMETNDPLVLDALENFLLAWDNMCKGSANLYASLNITGTLRDFTDEDVAAVKALYDAEKKAEEQAKNPPGTLH